METYNFKPVLRKRYILQSIQSITFEFPTEMICSSIHFMVVRWVREKEKVFCERIFIAFFELKDAVGNNTPYQH